MFCALILYVSGETYSLTSTPNDRFFLRNFLMAGFIYSSSFCQKSTERKWPKKYFLFHISFWCLTWDPNAAFTYNKPTHYLLDNGHLILYIYVRLISRKNLFWFKLWKRLHLSLNFKKYFFIFQTIKKYYFSNSSFNIKRSTFKLWKSTFL